MIACIENLIQNLLQVSISMAVVLAVVLLLLPLWQRRYSARWRKAIWLVIAVRLLIPFSLQLPSAPVQLHMDLQSAPAWTEQQTGLPEQPMTSPAVMPGAQNITINNHPAISPMGTKPASAVLAEQEKQPLSRGVVLFGLWMTGMLAVLLYHGVQYGCFRHKALACAQPLEDSAIVLQKAAADLNLRRYPAVLVSSQVQGPMLLGYMQPVILLPERIYSQRELLLILRHELMHYKQRDLWYKLILLLASAVHWFNPLVHWMNRQANRDVEQVCDEMVVQGQDMAYRKAYSMTILNTMASQRGIAMSTYLSREAQNSKKRFAAILQPKAYKRGAVVLATVILLVVMISGCLQLGSSDTGLGFYEKAAAFLPEDAITDPAAYTVMGEEEESAYLIYTWGEEPYEVPEEEAYGNGPGYTSDDGRHYRYQRWLTISVDKEDGAMVYMQYHRNEDDMKPPVKPAEIGRDAQARMNYVKKVARKLVDGGE
ncbi:MAG: M56 family metallopeptidase, partial [Peptococcaceae bacterium]